MKKWLRFRLSRSNERRYQKHHRDSMKFCQIDSMKKHSSFFFHSRHLIFRRFQKKFELMHQIFNNDYYENWIMNQIKYVEKNFDNIFRIIRWRKNELLNQFDVFVASITFAENWFVKIAFVAFATDFATINQGFWYTGIL